MSILFALAYSATSTGTASLVDKRHPGAAIVRPFDFTLPSIGGFATVLFTIFVGHVRLRLGDGIRSTSIACDALDLAVPVSILINRCIEIHGNPISGELFNAAVRELDVIKAGIQEWIIVLLSQGLTGMVF